MTTELDPPYVTWVWKLSHPVQSSAHPRWPKETDDGYELCPDCQTVVT